MSKKIFVLLFFALFFTAFLGGKSFALAALDIKTSYCGAVIDYKYCKCAFHNDEKLCAQVGMQQEQADVYVRSEFEKWKKELEQFCLKNKGYWIDEECKYPPSCSYRQVFIMDDFSCHDISEFCGPDPVIKYDIDKKKCYCPDDYDLEEKDGNTACVKKIDINLNVKFISGSRPPILADGKTQANFEISATYKKDNQSVELGFDVWSLNEDEKGQIVYSAGSPEQGYSITFASPDASDLEIETGSFINKIRIYYPTYKDRSKKEYLEHEIILYTKNSLMAKIFKDGFVEKQIPLPFITPKVKLLVYTKKGGQKYPVNQAEITYAKEYTYTYDDGSIVLEAPSGVKSIKEGEEAMEVELEMASNVEEWRQEAIRQYTEIKRYNNDIYEFLVYFQKKLAAVDGGPRARGVLGMLKSLNYSLFLINHGQGFAKDAIGMFSGNLTSMAWDLIDATLSMFEFSDKALEKMGSLGAKGLNLTQEKFELLKRGIETLPDTFIAKAWNKLNALLVKAAPSAEANIFKKLFESVAKTYIGAGLKKGYDATLEFTSINDIISNAFLDGYKKNTTDALLRKISAKLKSGNFDESLVKLNIEATKSEYEKFISNYTFNHNFEYNQTFVADSVDLFRGTIIEGINIYFAKSAEGACKVFDGVWSALKMFMSSDRMLRWLTLYDENNQLVKKNINFMMQIFSQDQEESMSSFPSPIKVEDKLRGESGYNQNKVEIPAPASSAGQVSIAGMTASLAPKARAAEEIDELQRLYLNEKMAGEINPDRNIVIDYYENKNDLDFYNNLANIISVVSEIDSENEEALSLKEEILAKVNNLEEEVKKNKDKIDEKGILKAKMGDLEKTMLRYGIYWLIGFVLIISGVVFYYLKKRKKLILLIVIALLVLIVWTTVISNLFANTQIARENFSLVEDMTDKRIENLK